MKCKTIKLNSYNIHFVKTDDFKTIEMRIFFMNEFSREEISKRNFLFDMLIYSTKKYNTNRLLNLRCQELYSLNLNSATFRIGNYLLSKIGLSFLNPKYTEDCMLEESLDLLFEVLFNPNVINSKFPSQQFEQIKKDLLLEAETIKEQPRVYSNFKMLEKMGGKQPYAYHGYCYPEDLDKITEENLYDYYKQVLQTNLVNIFVVGDFDFDEMEQLIRQKFKIDTMKKPKKDILIKHEKFRVRSQKAVEIADYQQSKLSIGCKIREMTDFEFRYVSGIYSMLLGGHGDSILMKNVREKESLAYYANSFLNKADSILMINCGIDGKNFDKTVRIIKKSMKQVIDGEFSEEDIKKCQLEYLASLDMATTNSGSLIDLKLSEYLGLTDDIEIRKKQVMKVTKEDLINFGTKVCIDTIYLLKGER